MGTTRQNAYLNVRLSVHPSLDLKVLQHPTVHMKCAHLVATKELEALFQGQAGGLDAWLLLDLDTLAVDVRTHHGVRVLAVTVEVRTDRTNGALLTERREAGKRVDLWCVEYVATT